MRETVTAACVLADPVDDDLGAVRLLHRLTDTTSPAARTAWQFPARHRYRHQSPDQTELSVAVSTVASMRSRRTPQRAARQWTSLTTALDDPANRVRKEVDRMLVGPALRGLQDAYRVGAGELRIVSLGAPADLVGTASDLALRFLVDPAPDLELAAIGAANCWQPPADDVWARPPVGPDPIVAAVESLIAHVGGVFGGALQHGESRTLTTPLQVPSRDTAALARACWALAMFVHVYRTHRVDDPLAEYLRDSPQPTVSELLELATPAAIDEVGSIVELARSAFLPALSNEPAPWHVGPVFTASAWMSADADLIAGHTLVEIKTNLGKKRVDGSRYARLSKETLRQVVCYVLHDVDDLYQLKRVAIYDGRYGAFTSWPLQQLLDQLAGQPVDLVACRAAHRHLLTGGRSQPR